MKRRGVRIAIVAVLFTAGIAFAQARFFEQGEVTVNPYSPVTVTAYQVKGFSVYSSTVNYKLAINGTTYTPMNKGGAFNFSDLNVATLTLRIQGNTASDTGLVYYIITK